MKFRIFTEPQEADTFLKEQQGVELGTKLVDFRSFKMIPMHTENYKASSKLTERCFW